MKIYDSNLLIYSFQPEYAWLRAEFIETGSFISEISRLETLGFSKISQEEIEYFQKLFIKVKSIEPNRAIINQAISLRQKRKMSLGDAIIAATALVNDFEIHTNNVEDFNWIKGILVIDPLN